MYASADEALSLCLLNEFMEFGFIIILYVFVNMYVLYIVCIVSILNGIVMLTVSMYH